MFGTYTGEIAALLTAFLWTIAALSFESAGKRVGALPVNLIRLVMALICFTVYSMITSGRPFPFDAPLHTLLWLSLSGFIGFFIGDLFLFQAFVEIGSRITMLIYASVPPLTAVIGWFVLGESLTYTNFIGMGLTVGGIALVVLEKGEEKKGVRFTHPLKGLLFAFGGSLGQAAGLIMSKFGAPDYDAFSATQIRSLSGALAFFILILCTKKLKQVKQALANRKAMGFTASGAFFGPFIGVSLSLLAVQYIATGVASTIMAIIPVLIIPPAVIFLKEKVSPKEIIGALIAVTGTAVMFIR
jgi:drug/metabolite transporter (DMT)-like permease